jgi:ABC-2 type transport system ATP-binding protein
MSKVQRQDVIPDLLELVSLGDRANTPLRAFSKGMLQRVGLAQALINDPDLVFLDEPTSGLDPNGRRLVRDIINNLRELGTAVFLNSHLLSEVEKTCDRVTFIRLGQTLETINLHEFNEENVHLSLRVGEPTPQLLTDLAQFGQDIILEKGNGRIELCLPEEATIPKLVNWLSSEGYNLYELTPRRISLEDRFLQIVGDETG